MTKAVYRVITNSERGAFACEKKWFFRYHAGLTTSATPAPLRYGSLWHECLAAWYRSQCKMSVAELMAAVVAPWREFREQWQREQAAHNDGIIDSEAEDEDAEMAVLIEGMLTGYLAEFATDADGWEVIAVEAQAARPLGFKDAIMLANGERVERTWLYGGALDLIVRERATGNVWLVEHKTTSQSDLSQYVHKLHWDPQIRGYAWIMLAPVRESDVREPMRLTGVIYNVARKKLPREPELLKNGKALSKAACDTTRDVFMHAILRHGLNPDDYADQLDKLAGKRFFARERYVFTDPEIDAFEHDARAAAFRIMRAEQEAESQDHPRQVAVCQGVAPMPCPYASICIEDGPMARRSFTVQSIRHAELKDEFAETYVSKMRGCNESKSMQQQDEDPFTR